MLFVAALVLYAVLLVSTCTYAIWRGGKLERAGAICMIAAVVASQVVVAFGQGWRGPDYGLLGADALFFVALVVIAHMSKRFWPLWAAASQLVGTLTHFVVMFDASAVGKAYATVQPFWAFPILAAIAIGTRGAQLERR